MYKHALLGIAIQRTKDYDYIISHLWKCKYCTDVLSCMVKVVMALVVENYEVM